MIASIHKYIFNDSKMEWTAGFAKNVPPFFSTIFITIIIFLVPSIKALENDTGGDFEDFLRENYRGPIAFFVISVLLFVILMLSCCLYVSKRGNLHNPDAVPVDFN